MTQAFRSYADGLQRRSEAITRFFSLRMRLILLVWLGVMIPIAAFKLGRPSVEVGSIVDFLQMAVPYYFTILAPVLGYLVGVEAFHRVRGRQPRFRIAVFGKWRGLDAGSVSRHPLYGPTGFMTSLLAGMMLNVAFRTGEYLLAMPALNANAPEWGYTMFLVMSADVIVMNFFYMVCFAMALKSIPLFPRMLLYVWVIDIAMQLTIAREVGLSGAPPEVVQAIAIMLDGNVQKVLIGAAIWLPYLLLSERVNVTFRHRTAAQPVVLER